MYVLYTDFMTYDRFYEPKFFFVTFDSISISFVGGKYFLSITYKVSDSWEDVSAWAKQTSRTKSRLVNNFVSRKFSMSTLAEGGKMEIIQQYTHTHLFLVRVNVPPYKTISYWICRATKVLKTLPHIGSVLWPPISCSTS